MNLIEQQSKNLMEAIEKKRLHLNIYLQKLVNLNSVIQTILSLSLIPSKKETKSFLLG